MNAASARGATGDYERVLAAWRLSASVENNRQGEETPWAIVVDRQRVVASTAINRQGGDRVERRREDGGSAEGDDQVSTTIDDRFKSIIPGSAIENRTLIERQ